MNLIKWWRDWKNSLYEYAKQQEENEKYYVVCSSCGRKFSIKLFGSRLYEEKGICMTCM